MRLFAMENPGLACDMELTVAFVNIFMSSGLCLMTSLNAGVAEERALFEKLTTAAENPIWLLVCCVVSADISLWAIAMVGNDPHPSNIGISITRVRAGREAGIIIKTDTPFIVAMVVGPPMLP
jgi:hypothetical protein